MPLDLEFTTRMDTNCASYWREYARVSGGEYREFSDAVFMYSNIPLFLFNNVFVTGQNVDALDEVFAAAQHSIAAKGTPVLWRICPSAATGAVKAKLEQLGLQLVGQQPAMHCDLTEFDPTAKVEGLRIELIEGQSARHDWAAVAAEAFELDPASCKAMAESEGQIPDSALTEQWRYLGILDGKPVATSALGMADGLAGVFVVGTLPEFRNKGIGTAMTLHAMAEGKKRGATSSILQATDMGKPVYEEIGFSTVYNYDFYVQA